MGEECRLMPDKYGFAIKASERDTLKALKAERRPADERDVPPPKPFPGPHRKATPGQLDVFGGETA